VPDDFQAFYDDILQASISENIPEIIRQYYDFLSCLGFGESKELYIVQNKQTGDKGILRVTKGEAGEDASDEARILRGLDHPAIPKIIGEWEDGGRTFMLREYFDGLTLHALVKGQGVLKSGRIIDIAAEICGILRYLGRQAPPVVHRDIKPENILLAKDGGVKLIDFGIARQFSPGSAKDTKIIGTEPYMAPEQFGYEQTDGRADIYSLGVAMIYMATGGTDKSNLKKTYPYRPLVPIIRKCIKKDRDRRFSDASRLSGRLIRQKNRTAKKLLLFALALACAAAAFAAGFEIGQERGFSRGVDFIMDAPTFKNLPFSQEELDQPITFENWYLDMAVRTALNKDGEAVIYRREVFSRIDKIKIYGTLILHPSFERELLKFHKDKGNVAYYVTDSGFWPNERGDIGSLDEIPNMYYLRDLTLTSQSIADLSPIAGMKLEKICLCDNFIGNLLPIKDMVTLRELDLCQNPLKDLTPISRLSFAGGAGYKPNAGDGSVPAFKFDQA